ncbi:MAG: DUF2330 domain-containing protein, partial [Deltaproteobacteria bacterium]|nr:DUF2330 domain-containing protein [Deltaproteobacteria bacterium]
MRDHIHGPGLGLAALAAALAVLLVAEPVARACGCLSPPAVTEGEFAINQRAEQIIFEVEPGWVTAHVLIKYAGDPSKFAWIVPVPEVPELAISPISAFGLLDRLTAPVLDVGVENICPISEWACVEHDRPSCGRDLGDDHPSGAADAGASSDAGGGGQPPVTVINEQVVGDYQTVTFRASEATAATQWLRDNGFIVNETTSIYMESYVQANMVFVAAKLVPGAGASSIKPLRMRYRAAFPTIPLVLTAVAAEPHLTISAFVFGSKPFRPQGHPVVTIDGAQLARDANGRLNYPMVLARTVDAAGGDGFAIEYRGTTVRPEFGGGGFCCGSDSDRCGIGNNQQCECPRDEFDRNDCQATGDLVDGVALLDDLATRYPALTRITTRVSPEEMTFDPAFEPDYTAAFTGRMVVSGTQPTLRSCGASVIDQAAFEAIDDLQGCAALYCGTGGQCATTAAGPACVCGEGFVAQRFTDLDALPSVTCVPAAPPVDLRAGGHQLPDACASVSCGAGSCVDRNGVAVCACDT